MQTDPSITYRLTTAAAPEWAAATGDARDAEIARLRAELAARDEKIAGLYGSLYARNQAINRIDCHRDELTRKFAEQINELADVKAECCRLTCRNGDLEAENTQLRAERDRLIEGCVVKTWRSGTEYIEGGNGYEWRYGPHGEFVNEKSHAIAAVRKAARLSETEAEEAQ